MMHHPNMHHQPMSGHPPQHMGGHQGMPGHHQLPHQMHRENRHVALTRMPLGPGQGGHGQGMGAHGPALGGHGQGMGGHGPAMGGMPVHHQPQRPPHQIRAMHHPQPPHHNVPPQQMKAMRRAYVGGAYGAGSMSVPTYAPPARPPAPPAPPAAPPVIKHATHTAHTTQPPPAVVTTSTTTSTSTVTTLTDKSEADEAPRDEARNAANSKEKTPMCLVNELARYNKIKHQYRLTSETGPAHKKVFTVTLRLGDTEEYTAEGSSIKRAQHAAAAAALAGTRLGAPPPRSAPAGPAQRPHGAVMPTVELNALAMKLCQPAVYSVVAGRPRVGVTTPLVPGVLGSVIYRVRVGVGGRAWLGEGATPQAARHDAAARALHDLRPVAELGDSDTVAGDASADLLSSEVKSPVSLVHELALKRNLCVAFSVKSERGPPHMRVFVTTCTVGDMSTEGEGNGKKVSKRRAAERMLDLLRTRWPHALRAAAPAQDKRRQHANKKKPRNLIKESGASPPAGADNPISRLAVARHVARARSPQYVVVEERGAARRREFLVQCSAPPHRATGLGPNKKTAKRRAAINVLLAMELSAKGEGATQNTSTDTTSTNTDTNKTTSSSDTKRKEGAAPSGGCANSEVRQPVPGVLLMDYHTRSGQPTLPNGVSETAAGGGSPGAKEQLMYLSQLLGFTVQFSDFPKRNHGEYLSLVSLSTTPPVMCHGGGASTALSHEQCARAALKALALMGLDTTQSQTPSSGASKPVVSNGIAE